MSHWRSRSRAGVVAEEEAWGEPCSWHADAVSAQGQDHLEQVQGHEKAGGLGTGGRQGGRLGFQKRHWAVTGPGHSVQSPSREREQDTVRLRDSSTQHVRGKQFIFLAQLFMGGGGGGTRH